MKRTWLKRTLIGSASIMLILVAILSVHIYVVTRPNPNLVAMARIDIKQPIDNNDAGKIEAWLYKQKGVDHVLCNPKTSIAVFTFHPVQTSANEIVSNFKTSLNYKAERCVPTEAQMQGGCPMSSSSFTYKAYALLKHLI